MPIKALIVSLSLIFSFSAQADNASMLNQMLNNNPNIIDFDSFINSEMSLQNHLFSARHAESMTPEQYRQRMVLEARQADMTNPAYHRDTYRAALHRTEDLSTLARAKYFSDKLFRRGDLIVPASHNDILRFLQMAERTEQINDIHHFKTLHAEKLWQEMETKAVAKNQLLRVAKSGNELGVAGKPVKARGKNVHILKPNGRTGLAIAAGALAAGLLVNSKSAKAEASEDNIEFEDIEVAE